MEQRCGAAIGKTLLKERKRRRRLSGGSLVDILVLPCSEPVGEGITPIHLV